MPDQDRVPSWRVIIGTCLFVAAVTGLGWLCITIAVASAS